VRSLSYWPSGERLTREQSMRAYWLGLPIRHFIFAWSLCMTTRRDNGALTSLLGLQLARTRRRCQIPPVPPPFSRCCLLRDGSPQCQAPCGQICRRHHTDHIREEGDEMAAAACKLGIIPVEIGRWVYPTG